MKLFPVLSVFFVLTYSFVAPVYAEDAESITTEVDAEQVNKQDAFYWLAKLKQALTKSNFDAGIVKIRGNKTESSQWLHGYIEGIGEIEQISPLIGGRATTVRHNSNVTFFEKNNEPMSVSSVSIRQFIPPIFYKDVHTLVDSYRFVLVSKSQIAGRSAQLLRIESIDNTAYNYWIWIDTQSGLPLRMTYVSEANEVVEQVLMTHLRIYTQPTEEIKKLSKIKLPMPMSSELASRHQTNNWQMTWLPTGFNLIKSDRHHISINREVSDYYLYSDGLVDISIYVQRPLESFTSPVVWVEGATSFVMVSSSGYDVTVVGKIPPKVAHKIAKSVQSVEL